MIARRVAHRIHRYSGLEARFEMRMRQVGVRYLTASKVIGLLLGTTLLIGVVFLLCLPNNPRRSTALSSVLSSPSKIAETTLRILLIEGSAVRGRFACGAVQRTLLGTGLGRCGFFRCQSSIPQNGDVIKRNVPLGNRPANSAARNQADKEQHDKNRKQDLSDPACSTCNAAETNCTGDNRNN